MYEVCIASYPFQETKLWSRDLKRVQGTFEKNRKLSETNYLSNFENFFRKIIKEQCNFPLSTRNKSPELYYRRSVSVYLRHLSFLLSSFQSDSVKEMAPLFWAPV